MADLHQRLVAAVGNRYTVEREIGRGGMGVVYHGVDRRLKRHVAIKVLPPELAFRSDVRTRFLREAQTAAQLSHPNIVPIYEVDEREGLVYFVMAFVDGENLGARLAGEPRPPAEMVARVLRDVADALSAAHARGIIHRDVKPDNILLERSTDRAMVTDFGIARAAEGGSRLTATGVAVGTPTYMSPEQAEGADAIDGRSDIYSLAVVGYQMLAGEPPFTSTSTPALLMQHLTDEPPPLRTRRADVPPRLEGVITRALAKHAEDRWPDAGTMRDALDAVLAEMRAPAAARPALDATLAIDAREAAAVPVASPAPEAPRKPAEDLLHVAREMPAARVRTDASAAAPHRDDRSVGSASADRKPARDI
jgi:serine/threonine-protein kinase